MLTGVLNECIIEMKDVKELENTLDDTKKQAKADYDFKMVVLYVNKMVCEIKSASENVGFKPSANIISSLKSIVYELDKVVGSGVAKEGSTSFLSKESKNTYVQINEYWKQFYQEKTSGILSLLDTVKEIIEDKQKTQYTINKIKKGFLWNTEENNLMLMRTGLKEASIILNKLELDDNIVAFIKLVGDGSATLANLTKEIIDWIQRENLSEKLTIGFKSKKTSETFDGSHYMDYG